MKKLTRSQIWYRIGLFILMLFFIFCAYKVQAQTFVEIFSNTLTNEYKVTNEICDSLGFIYVNHHIHREDPFTIQQSKNRHYNIGAGYIPEAYINGVRVYDITSYDEFITRSNQTIPQNTIYIEGDVVPQSNLTHLLNYTITSDVEQGTLFAYIVEDIGDNPRVLREMFKTEGTTLQSTLNLSTLFKTQWNIDNCRIIFTIENDQHKILACKEMTLQESITTGINLITTKKMELKIYPNPTNNHIDIEYEGTINSIELYSMQGQLMNFEYNPSYNKIDVSNFPNGTYFLILNNNLSTTFIKR